MDLKFIFVCVVLLGCGPKINKPTATLREQGRPASVHLQAMDMLDEQVGLDDAQYRDSLHRMLWAGAYTNDAREAALKRLWMIDREGVIKTIRQRLPRMDNWTWIELLCKWIGEERVVELDEALISSWAQQEIRYQNEEDRPERKALVALYGEKSLADIIFHSLLSSNKSGKKFYRIRCWELLLRIGERDRLSTLLEGTAIPENYLFLLDLQRAFLELGIMPQNKEEIYWIRELCKPEHSNFWVEAVDALALLDDNRREALEMRDVPIAVTVARHWPELATTSTSTLVRLLETKLKDRQHYFEYEGGGNVSTLSELFKSHKQELTWGDAVAIQVALAAMEVPEVRAHFFDFANRDRLDTTTEFGGVVELDERGRYVIQEFEPQIRNHDRRFDAPQKMFDAAYTSLFHFHFHAQKYRNGNHAGPGMGDKNYADNTRANCLVLTFVNKSTMNVDYYRHGHVVVDLGTMTIN